MLTTDTAVRQQIIYQIFTRNYPGGGTFAAVEKDLGRIKALGADWIYLLPVQPSGKEGRKGSVGSPYAISDYRVTDPCQGTTEEFISLTRAAHKIGLKVMIDVVYNHTSPDSVLAKTHPEWFFQRDGKPAGHHPEWSDVVDLDYTQKDLWAYQIETLCQWAKYVDGFRCDVAPLVPLEFWLMAREAVEKVRPGCLWLAESVEPEFIRRNRSKGVHALSDGELYGAFDILYDYDVYHTQLKCMTGEIAPEVYTSLIERQEGIYPENYSKLRCLENHDRLRAAGLLGTGKALLNWTAWMFFLKGTPMLYAGQEFGVKHLPSLFEPDPVSFETGTDLTPFFKKLIEMKKQPVFKDGAFSVAAAGPKGDVLQAVQEDLEGRRACGFFSLTGEPRAMRVSLKDGFYTDFLSGKACEVRHGMLLTEGEPLVFLS